ncbi:hypothetical protein BDV95DRAFT_627374 [Massariosphaeria phaeospora]|uniref:Calcium channel YVC1-like C-terminal transmembrane domain-containing protein n=1 Tax=Massariosphaeria phaeospora TaxID=100035 RepID=A0A7C8I8N8_9PLEO|nr:hypothetical protein BDV95DRAFT_627374 [Massariosphaeria phaeospora]
MSLPSTPRWPVDPHPEVPTIADNEEFEPLVKKLSFYFTEAITLPHTFEELRTLPFGRILTPLISYISDTVHHPALISALLALKAHFSALEEASDEPGVNEARGYACEYVAWQFLTNLTEREAIDFLLYDLPPIPSASDHREPERGHEPRNQPNEEAPLLAPQDRASSYFGTDGVRSSNTKIGTRSDDFVSRFENLSALEIAAVSGSKKFLSQRPVQKIINGLWRGDIVFWETLSVHSVKCPKLYNRKRTDIFSRLRVPRYLKVFETLFFAVFLALYYAVSIRRSFVYVTPTEVLLYIWIAGFAYDELGGWMDAGQASFYSVDFWWTWDISIVVVGMIFCALRITGLTIGSNNVIDLAYDVLGLEALFLVPRIFSLLSLNQYFGTLIPCLKAMTKDFVKFLSLVVILYLGFLTTFVLLARGQYTPSEMSWILVNVFFGSPYFGPPVMLVFIALTNILLITSLISLLSNSLSKILDHAREEYLFGSVLQAACAYPSLIVVWCRYSIYVLEATTSNRLTYYLPPLNLLPLVLRPLRLFLPSERLRSARIVLLKATHLPFVGAIWAYEQLSSSRKRNAGAVSISGPSTPGTATRTLRSSIHPPRPMTAGLQSSSIEGNGSTPNRAHPAGSRTGHSEADPQLKTLVLKLTSQVEELTAVVSQLQQRGASQAA